MTRTYLPIRTDRLALRFFTSDDLDAVVAYACRPDVLRYVDGKPRDRNDVRAMLEEMCRQVSLNRPGDTLAIALSRLIDGRVIGQMTLTWQDATASQAEVRIVLNPQFRRRGYGVEALRALIDLGFSQFHFHRIFARCDARDGAARMLRRVGMRLEAHYREHALFQGEWDEELHFAVLDREWQYRSDSHELAHLVA